MENGASCMNPDTQSDYLMIGADDNTNDNP
jgi:hypothetical protein